MCQPTSGEPASLEELVDTYSVDCSICFFHQVPGSWRHRGTSDDHRWWEPGSDIEDILDLCRFDYDQVSLKWMSKSVVARWHGDVYIFGISLVPANS